MADPCIHITLLHFATPSRYVTPLLLEKCCPAFLRFSTRQALPAQTSPAPSRLYQRARCRYHASPCSLTNLLLRLFVWWWYLSVAFSYSDCHLPLPLHKYTASSVPPRNISVTAPQLRHNFFFRPALTTFRPAQHSLFCSNAQNENWPPFLCTTTQTMRISLPKVRTSSKLTSANFRMLRRHMAPISGGLPHNLP